MSHPRITMRDPSGFRDPFSLTWPKYITMQAREKEHYEQQKGELSPEALDFKLADPAYLEEVTHCQFLDNYFAELSATKYLATVVRNAPFEELKKCALFQIIDEQRHMEMDAEVLRRAGVPEAEWFQRWRDANTTYRFFEHVVTLEDPMEIILKANFLGETGAVTASFDVLAQWARRKGDPLSAINHEARLRDESRHSKTGWVLAKALIDDDEKNLAVIQEWQDEALELWYVVSKDGTRQQWWDNFQASYFRVATPLGLKQPAA